MTVTKENIWSEVEGERKNESAQQGLSYLVYWATKYYSQLISWIRVHLEKLLVTQLLKKIPALHTNCQLTAAFKVVHIWSVT